MNFNIRGENLEVTPAIRSYVEKKLNKVDKLVEKNFDYTARVNLKVINNQESKVEATIPMPKAIIRAEGTNEDMYAAIDLVIDKIERQVKKYKAKLNKKSKKTKAWEISQEDINTNTEFVEEYELVRSKRFNIKPMDVDEAILQMDMLGHDFFVFTNIDTNSMNVVYLRKDGKYGLIESNKSF